MVKNLPVIRKTCRSSGFNSWVGKIPWRSKWQPTLVFLPGKSLGWKNLVSYSPGDRKRVGHGLVTKQPLI